MEDHITRTIELAAAPSRVWAALVDHVQFGTWFKCTVDEPFRVGEVSTCRSTYEGQEELVWQKLIKAIEPERYFAWEWAAGDTGADIYDPDAPSTLVEFTLTPTEMGTRLVIHESGFASLPADMAPRAFRLNTGGWDAQVTNLTGYHA